jgi:hypothetical protein
MLEVVDIAAWGRDFAAPHVMLAAVGVRNVIPHRQRPSALVLRRWLGRHCPIKVASAFMRNL